MSHRLVKKFKMENHGIQKLRLGDVNGDGYTELVLAQSYPMNREICAVTAIDLDGNVLWRHGDIIDYCDYAYSDIPVQVMDWDGDGQQEVLYIKQAYYKSAKFWRYSTGRHEEIVNPSYETLRFDHDLAAEFASEYEGDAMLMVLDGSTGAVKEQIPIPAPADDSFVFGHFDGTGKWNVLVKDRYWNEWALDHDGKILWHLSEEKHNIHMGHCPAIGDIDGDGLDEVFITDTLFDHNGSILWKLPEVYGHHDAAYILDDLAEPVIFTIADRVRMINLKGEVLWSAPGGHLQMAHVGKYMADEKYGPYQFLVEDMVPAAKDYHEGCKMLDERTDKGQRMTLFDFYGNVIWVEENEDDRPGYGVVNWKGSYDCIRKSPRQGVIEIRDLVKGTVETLQFDTLDGSPVGNWLDIFAADILSDPRDELIVYNDDTVNVFMNTDAFDMRRHFNFSGYQPAVTR